MEVVSPITWTRRTRLRHVRRTISQVALSLAMTASLSSAASASTTHAHVTGNNGITQGTSPVWLRCPWVQQSRLRSLNSVQLANEVLAHMTLSQKIAFVVLRSKGALENLNTAIPSLCIPALTLVDGPNGLGNGLRGVTQFPSAIGVAASFNVSLARAVGAAMGRETRAKGINVLQGPSLNLVRVAQSGRTFETFGEDAFLTSAMGVADVRGIQSTGVMAEAKHFSAYTQETARTRLNQIVSSRALAELYNAPFEAVVRQAHVASLMCSMGMLNGVRACEDPLIYATLRSWGFNGFVRSDLRAVRNAAASFKAGLSIIKPSSLVGLVRLVQRHALPVSDLNRAVRAVLGRMFAFGLIARQRAIDLFHNVQTPSASAVALRAAEQSIVLLKNQGGVLPLTKRDNSVAVIGADATTSAVSSGGGSSAVTAPFVITPLLAIRSAFGRSSVVRYASGGSSLTDLDTLSDLEVVGGTLLPPLRHRPPSGEPGKSDLVIDSARNVTAAIATANHVGTGEGWSHWQALVRAKRTGTYEVGVQNFGDTWLYLNHRLLVASRGVHALSSWSTTVQLRAGQRYSFTANWYDVNHRGTPTFAISNVSRQIAAAVALARNSKVAIVFVGCFSAEGADRPNLSLPGDANALISAVAKVNPHTIVVLNTGGAVLMPWLAHVQGVIEAWYPGQFDGLAIARVLSGAIDPSGRLPITFPVSQQAQSAYQNIQFPGVGSTVQFGSVLDVGYRWYQAHHVRPLFPFGFGLGYTLFKYSHATLVHNSSGVHIHLTVTNRGTRAGADVVQAYVRYPPSAGEPPRQLRAFIRVSSRAHASQSVTLNIAPSGFSIFRNSRFVVLPGRYTVVIGESSSSSLFQLPINLP